MTTAMLVKTRAGIALDSYHTQGGFNIDLVENNPTLQITGTGTFTGEAATEMFFNAAIDGAILPLELSFSNGKSERGRFLVTLFEIIGQDAFKMRLTSTT